MVATKLRKWIVIDKLTWLAGVISPRKYNSWCDELPGFAFWYQIELYPLWWEQSSPAAYEARGRATTFFPGNFLLTITASLYSSVELQVRWLIEAQGDSKDQGETSYQNTREDVVFVISNLYFDAAVFISSRRLRSYPIFLLTLHSPRKNR